MQAVFSRIVLVVIALHKRPAFTEGRDPAFLWMLRIHRLSRLRNWRGTMTLRRAFRCSRLSGIVSFHSQALVLRAICPHKLPPIPVSLGGIAEGKIQLATAKSADHQAPGRTRTSAVHPHHRAALPTELPGHICRPSLREEKRRAAQGKEGRG